MASHGADQLIVQRLLACRGLSDARKALIGSGFVVLLQMSLFLAIGVMLFAFFNGRPIDPAAAGAFHAPDEVFPTFIVRHLPGAVSAYLVAGIFSAAMCSESSALNSLASALAHDVVGPLAGKGRLEGRPFRVTHDSAGATSCSPSWPSSCRSSRGRRGRGRRAGRACP